MNWQDSSLHAWRDAFLIGKQMKQPTPPGVFIAEKLFANTTVCVFIDGPSSHA